MTNLADIHEFLSVLRDAFHRLGALRAAISQELGSRTWEEGVRTGQTGNWGGSPEEDVTYVAMGAWAAKPDSSEVVWGISLRSTPRYFEVEAEIYFERDPDTHVELWSKVTTHDQVEDACVAVKDGVEDLLSRTAFIAEIDGNPIGRTAG